MNETTGAITLQRVTIDTFAVGRWLTRATKKHRFNFTSGRVALELDQRSTAATGKIETTGSDEPRMNLICGRGGRTIIDDVPSERPVAVARDRLDGGPVFSNKLKAGCFAGFAR